MYQRDLENATEIVLNRRARACERDGSCGRHGAPARGPGSGRRAVVGAIRIGNSVGAAFTGRRSLEPVESTVMAGSGLVLLVFAVLFVRFPAAVAYPAGVLLTWVAVTLLYKGFRLRLERRNRKP